MINVTCDCMVHLLFIASDYSGMMKTEEIFKFRSKTNKTLHNKHHISYCDGSVAGWLRDEIFRHMKYGKLGTMPI